LPEKNEMIGTIPRLFLSSLQQDDTINGETLGLQVLAHGRSELRTILSVKFHGNSGWSVGSHGFLIT
jgi:hypothetical protein